MYPARCSCFNGQNAAEKTIENSACTCRVVYLCFAQTTESACSARRNQPSSEERLARMTLQDEGSKQAAEADLSFNCSRWVADTQSPSSCCCVPGQLWHCAVWLLRWNAKVRNSTAASPYNSVKSLGQRALQKEKALVPCAKPPREDFWLSRVAPVPAKQRYQTCCCCYCCSSITSGDVQMQPCRRAPVQPRNSASSAP